MLPKENEFSDRMYEAKKNYTLYEYDYEKVHAYLMIVFCTERNMNI